MISTVIFYHTNFNTLSAKFIIKGKLTFVVRIKVAFLCLVLY
jgi:hypothetical protein